MKSSKVCITTKSPLASLLFKGLVTKHTTVKWNMISFSTRPFLTVHLSRVQLVLTGGAIIAGEYEVALQGIYGDDLPLPEANRELLPLLQRLIRLLEEGMPVLMNSAGQVVGGGHTVHYYRLNR